MVIRINCIRPVSSRRPSRRRGFSIASILLLTAVVAIYVAALQRSVVAVAKEELESVIAFGVIGLVLGVVVGVFVGVMQQRRLRGVLLGLAAGAICGVPSAMLLLVPDSLYVILVGAVVIVFYAGVVRSLSSPGPKA